MAGDSRPLEQKGLAKKRVSSILFFQTRSLKELLDLRSRLVNGLGLVIDRKRSSKDDGENFQDYAEELKVRL